MKLKPYALAAVVAGMGAASAADTGPYCYSVLSAAETALNEALDKPDNVEQAGGIYACGDKYSYTRPQASARDSFHITLRIPKGCTLAGIYHTHPLTANAERFSDQDIATARALNVPSFIAVSRTGEMRQYDPTRSATALTRGRIAFNR